MSTFPLTDREALDRINEVVAFKVNGDEIPAQYQLETIRHILETTGRIPQELNTIDSLFETGDAE